MKVSSGLQIVGTGVSPVQDGKIAGRSGPCAGEPRAGRLSYRRIVDVFRRQRTCWERLRSLVTLGLLCACVRAGEAQVVPLPNAAFTPGVDMTGWTLGNGVALDGATGAQAPGSLRFALAPPLTNTSATVKLNRGLEPWRWHRLSFAYRLSPGVSASVTWSETDAQGVIHTRSSADRLRLAPAAEFTTASFDFLSRPDCGDFAVSFEARLVSEQLTAGGLYLDDLSLQALAAAPTAPPQVIERAIPNHDFESPNAIGYYSLLNGATAVVTEGDAASGRRYLQVRGSAHLYPPLRQEFLFKHGRMYRLSLWARGKGAVTPGLHVGSWLFDLDYRYLPQVFPLSQTEWREIRADLIIDNGDLRPASLVLVVGGEVDVDKLEVRQLR